MNLLSLFTQNIAFIGNGIYFLFFLYDNKFCFQISLVSLNDLYPSMESYWKKHEVNYIMVAVYICITNFYIALRMEDKLTWSEDVVEIRSEIIINFTSRTAHYRSVFDRINTTLWTEEHLKHLPFICWREFLSIKRTAQYRMFPVPEVSKL